MTDTAPLELQKLIANVGLGATPRKKDPQLWDKFLSEVGYVPLQYIGSSLDYQLEYHSAAGGVWEDWSFLLQSAGKPVAAWPLTFSKVESAIKLSSQGQDITPLIFLPTTPTSVRKKLVKKCHDFLNLAAQAAGQKEFRTAESFSENASLSLWQLEGMRRGATCEIRHELYVDTHISPESIFAGFRDTLQNTIKQASKLWSPSILMSAEPQSQPIWNEFKDLHFSVAGRKTRSDQSWQLQHDAIEAGHALLIYLRDAENKMIGGGFFEFSKDEVNYSVGAYDRTLFDKPIGHLVQWAAIQEFTKRKIRWYKIGYCPFPSDIPAPSEKEISIGEFKKGFATHVFPKFILKHPVQAPPQDAG